MNRRQFNKGLVTGMAAMATASVRSGSITHRPTVTGPISGGSRGYPFTSYLGSLEPFGYVEEEYFIAGDAQRYREVGELSEDGLWHLEPDTQDFYQTRLLVRKPVDPEKFNGVVLVEWMNVTLGHDIELAAFLSDALYQAGCAHVLASCQRVGIVGAGELPQGLHQWDSIRYASLNISGDSLSFDILTQIGRAVGPMRHFAGVDPLGGLRPERIFATGASQSAGRLRSYINGVHPLVDVYDGYLPTIDFGMGFAFNDFNLDPNDARSARRFLRSRIREDLNVPVFVVNSETESLMYFPSHQADSDRYRYWEVAGASHSPGLNARRLNEMRQRDGLSGMNTEYGSEVLWEPTADAALLHLIAWSRSGAVPPIAPKITVVVDKEGPRVVRDAHGNALGGVRLPDMDVPTATYTCAIRGFASPLGLRGKTEPFSKEKMRSLYSGPEQYLLRIEESVKASVQAGYILSERAEEYLQSAKTQNPVAV